MSRTRARAGVLGHTRAQQQQDDWAAMIDQVHALLARIDRGETTAAPGRLRCLRALVAPSAPTGPVDRSTGGRPEATITPDGDAAPRPGGAPC